MRSVKIQKGKRSRSVTTSNGSSSVQNPACSHSKVNSSKARLLVTPFVLTSAHSYSVTNTATSLFHPTQTMVAGIPILHSSNPHTFALPDLYDRHAASILDSSRPKTQRSASVESAPPNESPQAKDRAPRTNPVKYRTRSIGGPFSSGVYFERQIDLSPPNDDEIIIATVRVTNSFRRASIEGCNELPSR